MKLRDIYIKCKKNYEKLIDICDAITMEMGFKDTTLQTTIVDIKKLEMYIQDISDLEYLGYLTDKILKKIDDIFRYSSDNIENQNLKRMLENTNKLIDAMKCTMELCEKFGIEEESIGLDVKLPETSSLTDLKKYIEELEFIFTKCPFFQNEDENLKFKTIDIGSIWLTFAIIGGSLTVGSILLNNIAAFMDKCFIIKSHKLSVEQQKAEVKKANLDIEEKQKIYDSLDKVYKILVENSIKELEEISGYKLKDGEERGRTEQSFMKMGKLLDKGLKISASIDSPKEAKALFEPLDIYYISDKTKLSIEEKNKEN